MYLELTRLNQKKVTVNINHIVEFYPKVDVTGTTTFISFANHRELQVKEPYGYVQEKILKFHRVY